MKKLLVGLFIFGFLSVGVQQVHASILSDTLLQIKNLKNELISLQSKLKASVLDSSISTTPTTDLTPRISYYSGKINQHVDIATGTWQSDSDGTSGSGIDKLTYCQKWYPNTTSVSDYKTETINSWHDAGNANNYTSTRMSYKCVEGNAVNNLPDLIISDFYWTPENLIASSSVITDFRFFVTIKNIGTDSIVLPPEMRISVYKDDSFAAGIALGTAYYLLKPGDSQKFEVKTTQEPVFLKNSGTFTLTAWVDNNETAEMHSSDGIVKESNENNNFLVKQITIKPNTTTPSITVLSPNGGETYTDEQSVTVKWTSSNISSSSPVNLVLAGYRPDGSMAMYTLLSQEKILNDGSETINLHKIPTYAGINFGKNFKIFVTNGVGNEYLEDTSDNLFSIVSAPVVAVKSPCAPYGDVDGDGYLTEKDTNLMMQKIGGTTSFTYDQTKRADVNKDGVVTVMDITWIKNVISGTSTIFPACTSNTTPSITVLSPNGGEVYKAGDKITVKWKTENIPSDTFMQIVAYRVNSNNTPYQGFSTYPENAIHDIVGAPDNMTLNDGSEVISVDFPKDYSTGTDFKVYVRRISYDKLTQRVTDDSLLDWSDNTFTIVSTPVAGKVSPCSPYGDVDGDGYLTEKDTSLMMQKIGGIIPFTYDQSKRADVNKDGVVSSMDITWIKNVISGTSTSFPICTSNTTPSITVLSPNGGETYKQYDSMTVKWSSTNIDSRELVNVSLINVSNNSEIPLISNTPNDGVQGTVLSNNLNGTFKVKVWYNLMSSGGTLNPMDSSDSTFTINSSIITKCDSSTTPWIKVLSQNTTGISYIIGQTIPIKWETCNIPLTANIILDIVNESDSMDYPGNITMLNTGQGNYTIPSKNVSNNLSTFPAHLGQAVYKVRVDSKIPSLSYNLGAYSDNTFTINSSTIDTGCINGNKYSPTTGKLCPVLTTTTTTIPTAVANLVNSCGQTLFTDLLRIGSKGDQAESLQVLLNDQGYLADSDIDGSFGYKTWKALKAFQIANGLKGDGVMGQQTRNYFNTLWNKQCLAD